MSFLAKPKVPVDTKPKLDLNVMLGCTDCGDAKPPIIEDFSAGDLICGNCGLVLGDRIVDTRSEWRTFANDEGNGDPSRVGAAADPILGTNQLDTLISNRDGRSSSASKDLSKIQAKSVMTKSNERNLVKSFKDISAMCDHIALPKIISDIAKQLYKRVEDEKLVKSKSNEVVMASCIFIACRQENVPRTFKEICALTRVPKKEIGRCFKLLCREFETGVRTMQSGDVMSRFCNSLKLGMEIERAAVEVASKARDIKYLAGKTPVSIAAACIYFVSHLFGSSRTPKEISEVAGVTEMTIKTSYKALYKESEHVMKNVKGGDVKLLPTP
jgi:transcription initiation factor TFIIB